jgi:DNA helicase II / ATP-dependent DNA helicase PcrA
MTITVHLETLNGAQRKAVTHGEPVAPKGIKAGPLVVLAGTGTGKTTALSYRIAHLALHGVDPSRILLIVPTRRAASEMRRHAHDVVKKALNEPLGGVSQTISQRLTWAGTFHSIANRLLRHYGKHLKLDPQFTLIDSDDTLELLEQIRGELQLTQKDSRFPRRETCLQIYAYRVNTGKSLAETLALQFAWCSPWEEDLTRLFRRYVEHKQNYSILDHDDLLLYWHAMMSEAKLAQHISTHFDHVLVDDYQDANRLQTEILQLLKPDGAGMVLAADDTQAIHPLRLASNDVSASGAQRMLPQAEVVNLAQNYRSTQQVLDAANALLAEGSRNNRKHLLSIRGQGARPALIAVGDAQVQAECICTEIIKRREANVPLKRQAVLLRAASHSDALEVELARLKIPFTKKGNFKTQDNAHTRDVLAILRWIDNPRNESAALRVLQLLPFTDTEQPRRVLEHLAQHQYTLKALQSFVPPQNIGVQWRKLSELLLSLSEGERQWSGQLHLAREWYRPHFERRYEHFHTRIADLDRLELLSGQYPSRERFLTEISLDAPNAVGDGVLPAAADEDALAISTVFAARGAEWDVVYVLNVAEGGFPSESITGRPDQLEDERRLLYVAMTRARNDLVLVTPKRLTRTVNSRAGDTTPLGGMSRFVTEKVQKCCVVRGFEGSSLDSAVLGEAGVASIDIAARVKSMW